MTTASRAQYQKNLKNLKTALSGKFRTKPTTQSALVVGSAHVKIGGNYYDAQTTGLSGTVTVTNVGRPSAAIYSTEGGGRSTVITGGTSTVVTGPGDTDVDLSQLVYRDGRNSLTGSLAVATGATIDGVDISEHAANQNAHHNKIHSIIGADHTITGSTYQVIGLTATNTLGLLSSTTDAAADHNTLIRSPVTADTPITFGETIWRNASGTQLAKLTHEGAFIRGSYTDTALDGIDIVGNSRIDGDLEITGSISVDVVTGNFIYTGDGSFRTPSLSFQDDDDLGIFRSAENQMTFIANATYIAQFSDTQTWLINPTLISNLTVSQSATLNSVLTLANLAGDGIEFQNGGTLSGASGLDFVFAGADLRLGGALRVNTSYDAIDENQRFYALGSVTSPGFSFAGDPDTGMYRATTNTIGFATGGVLRLQVADATTSIANALSVTGAASFADGAAFNAGSTSDTAIQPSGDANTGIYFPAADTVGISTGGVLRLQVTDATTSVANALSVTGAATFAANAGGTGWTVTSAGVGTFDGTGSFAANTDANNILGRAIIGYASGSDEATFAHYDHSTSTNYALSQSSTGATEINAATGQAISLSINDVATFSVNAERMLPRGSVAVDLGDYNRKIRTIHAAELAVQTLIAQDVIATIGGQIIVAPTSKLIADISDTPTGSGEDDLYTNLVGYWSLDEVSGTRLDSVGTSHLTDKNTVTSTTGKIGVAAVFNRANNERLFVADNATLSLGDVDFYVSAWIYPTSDDGNTHCIVSKAGSSGNRAFLLQLDWADNRVEFSVYNSSDTATNVNSSVTLSINTWYFVEAWHNAASNQIGVAVNRTQNTASHSTGVKDDTGNFTIGAANAGSHFTGRIDEVGMWKGYIPDTTRRDFMYNSGTGRNLTDIFDYGTGGALTMDLEHNSFDAGDFLNMASAPGGIAQTEKFKITSSATPITGGYRYSVVRDLDGTGANNWYVGDTVTSLGGQIGEGYINLTADATIHNHFGPTIAHYVRRGTSAWDSVAPVVASGNLRSFVDYVGDEFGHAAGNDLLLTPEGGFKGYTIDTVNGMRTFNVDISLYEEEVAFLTIGSLSGIDIGMNSNTNNDNRAITFDFEGDPRAYIKGHQIGTTATIVATTIPVTGVDTSVALASVCPAGRLAQAFLYSQQGSDQSGVFTYQPSNPNDAYVRFQTTGRVEILSADKVYSIVDFDLNGAADIYNVANLGVGGVSAPTGLEVRADVLTTSRGTDNVRMGIVSGVPTIIIENAGSQWTIDNNGTDLRSTYSGTTYTSLSTSELTLNVDLDMDGNDIVGNIGTWSALSFGAGWGNFGSGYQVGQYKVIGDLILLRGMVARTSGSGTTIATLPSGSRPADDEITSVTTSSGAGALGSSASGVLQYLSGGVTWFSLSGIVLSKAS